MNTFLLVIMILVGPAEMVKIEVKYDTRNDCEITSAILDVMHNIYSVECFTMKSPSKRIDYLFEQGV